MTLSYLEARIFERLLSEARSPSAQANADDPYGQYLFAAKRADLKGTPAAKERDTPEEAELYAAFNDHYNNKGGYTLGGFAEEIFRLVASGKYSKLLAPPPGPFYRVVTDVDIKTLCSILGISPKAVVYGKAVKGGGGVMTPGGTLGGRSGVHSWTTSPDPSWIEEDLGASSVLFSRLRRDSGAVILLKATGGKNFFVNPAGMATVNGLGPYPAKQGEVVSFGPVEFSSSAYYAGKKGGGDAAYGAIEDLIALLT